MSDNKGIFETIIDVLRKANIGFSINEVKDIFVDQKREDDRKDKEKEDEYSKTKKW